MKGGVREEKAEKVEEQEKIKEVAEEAARILRNINEEYQR
jgi:hypothetical protein